MQKDKGQGVDMYIPWKCSATNRLIAAKQHSAVTVNVGAGDAKGTYIDSALSLSGCVSLWFLSTV